MPDGVEYITTEPKLKFIRWNHGQNRYKASTLILMLHEPWELNICLHFKGNTVKKFSFYRSS